jgi:hypothetical protein
MSPASANVRVYAEDYQILTSHFERLGLKRSHTVHLALRALESVRRTNPDLFIVLMEETRLKFRRHKRPAEPATTRAA